MKYKNLRSKPAPTATPFKSPVYDRLPVATQKAMNKLRNERTKSA